MVGAISTRYGQTARTPGRAVTVELRRLSAVIHIRWPSVWNPIGCIRRIGAPNNSRFRAKPAWVGNLLYACCSKP